MESFASFSLHNVFMNLSHSMVVEQRSEMEKTKFSDG
jgi:hypothetical protein